ncbi:DNA-binding transcriptional activator of the SARP family [Brevibacterium siliguriense]|uniref:DNA-binding transcriptional activator of the SARP family n=2 Tax=Brevibacterium siliguriense TaxID=1136497 RepID=A0A1H1R4P8_9MICO|nr:DNA-binding transcriptional activator of the SARP family [Brevibacterium siliguriense]
MGRVEILHDGVARGVQGRTQRALLSLLVLRLRTWTPASLIVEALWPDERSERVATRLHVQIHRLRKQLGNGVLLSSPNGYRLDLNQNSIDVWCFEHSARTALAEDMPDHDLETLRCLEAAAAQWGGEPFPDVDLPGTADWQSELRALYARIRERSAEFHLEFGDGSAALRLLTRLTHEHPENEHAQVLRLSALQHTGQGTELPRAFVEVHRALEELGLDPSPDLLHTQRALVRNREEEIRSDLAVVDPAGELIPDTEDEADPTMRGSVLRRELAYILMAKGRHSEALSLLERLEALHSGLGHENLCAILLRDMVAVMALTGDLRRALRLLGEASRLDQRTTGTDAMLHIIRALVLTHMSRLHRAEEALAAVGESTGPTARQVMWWRTRSQIDRRTGRHHDAVVGALTAWNLARHDSAEADVGPILLDVACSLRDDGNAECFEWYRSALRFAHEDMRFPLAASTHASMAKAQLLWGRPQTAIVHSRAGLELAQWSGCWLFAGKAAARLAEAEEQMGVSSSALRHRQEAQSFYRRIDFPTPLPVRSGQDDGASFKAGQAAQDGSQRIRSPDHMRS